MRARLALTSAGLKLEHREIVLRDKAPEFLAVSPKGTVPVVIADTQVIEQSLDVMRWALAQNDPEGLLEMPSSFDDLIEVNDTSFKTALDRTKYVNRYQSDPEIERANAQLFLDRLNEILVDRDYLSGAKPSMADFAILPFIRQFAHVDRERFDVDAPPAVRRWLDRFLQSDRFGAIMQKYPKWEHGQPTVYFSDDAAQN